MDPHPLPPAAAAAMATALADEGLDPSYAAFVLRHVHEDDAAWRWCCGSSCDPCVRRLGRVVDRVRQALCTPGMSLPGLPPAPGTA